MKDIFEDIKNFLPPVFNMDPLSDRAIQIASDGNLREVYFENHVLKIYTDANSYPDLKLDIRELTIQDVVDAISAVDGLAATLIHEDGSVSALRLIKPENDWDDAIL